MWRFTESGGIAPCILNASSRCTSVLAHLHSPAILPWEEIAIVATGQESGL